MILAACGVGLTPVSAARPATLKNLSANTVTASAVAAPKHVSRMSFAISAPVNETLVKKGDTVEAGDSVKAGQTLGTLETAILEAKVREAEANVIVKETQVAYLIRSGTSQENLDAAKADVERMKALTEIAKAQLAQATLVAPIDGTIASVDISPAEFVSPGQVVVVMGDLSHFQIETTDLSEKDVPNMKPGQSVNVFIKALNENFTGKVVDIARISESVGGDVVFKVTIKLDEQPAGLRWGMSADVAVQPQK